MIWSKVEEEKGKLIKIKNFPAQKKLKLFRVTVSANRNVYWATPKHFSTEYLATNDLTQSSTLAVIQECKLRWKIEEFHREVKQLTGLEACQCRQARIPRNHIACALLVWNFLKKVATLTTRTIYQVKTELLSNYLSIELQTPSIKMEKI